MKKIFITGGTGGLGRAIAMTYLREGHTVAVCGGTKKDYNLAFGKNTEINFYEVDVRNRYELDDAICDFSNGQLDIVIACAGISETSPCKGSLLDFNRANEIVDVNLRGVMNTFEAAIKQMSTQKYGQLVAISSVAGLAGLPGAPAYVTSKAAVNTFCESLAIRLKELGIDVTNILPGFIDTPLARATQVDFDNKPFVLSPEEAALKCRHAIDRKKFRYIFPLPVFLIGLIISSMPKLIYVWLYRMFYNTDGNIDMRDRHAI